MTDDNLLPFHLPAVRRKKMSAAVDGGACVRGPQLSSTRRRDRPLGGALPGKLAGEYQVDPKRHIYQLSMAARGRGEAMSLSSVCGEV